MNRQQIILIIFGAVLIGLAATGYEAGRRLEIERAAKKEANKTEPAPHTEPTPVEPIPIVISDISCLSFAELHDALRSAPREQRAEWTSQIESMKAGPKRNAALSSFFKTLVQFDVRQAIALIDQMHDRVCRQLASDAMFRAAPTPAMPELAEFYLRTSYRETGISGNFPEAIEEWSLVDPVAVSQFFDRHPDNVSIQANAYTLLRQWARIDPEQALNWFKGQKPFPETEDGQRYLSDAIHGLVYGWFDKDRPAAIDYAVANASEESFRDTIRNLSVTVFLTSQAEANAFIERLPNEQQQAACVNQITMWTTTRIYLGRRENDEDRRPADVMARWMVTLPEGAWAGNIAAVAGSWEESDSAAFAGWMNQLPARKQDVVNAGFCAAGDRNHPEQVLQKAATISDRQIREDALADFARGYGETPEEVAAALGKTKLSRAQQAQLVQLTR